MAPATETAPGDGGRRLAGRTVALAEKRELDRLATMLEGEGANVLRCPLVAILDAPDPAPVDAWLRELAGPGFDDLVFLTGEGVRRLLGRARHIDLHDAALAAMARARKITRGPKPARALHEVKLAADLPAPVPTSAGIMDALTSQDLGGRRVGVQLVATDPNEALVRFLAGKGAVVRTVAPYVYAPASDDDRVVDLVRMMEAGAVDAIAFTSASQVERLFGVAESRRLEPALRAGLGRTKVASIGPVVLGVLAEHGATASIALDAPFVMKRLAAAIVSALGR